MLIQNKMFQVYLTKLIAIKIFLLVNLMFYTAYAMIYLYLNGIVDISFYIIEKKILHTSIVPMFEEWCYCNFLTCFA